MSSGTARCPASTDNTNPPPAMRPLTSMTSRPVRGFSTYASAATACASEMSTADMVARDLLGLDARQFAGIDGLLDRNDVGAALFGAEPHQDLIAFGERLLVKPEDARAKPPRITRARAGMGDHVAAFDE